MGASEINLIIKDRRLQAGGNSDIELRYAMSRRQAKRNTEREVKTLRQKWNFATQWHSAFRPEEVQGRFGKPEILGITFSSPWGRGERPRRQRGHCGKAKNSKKSSKGNGQARGEQVNNSVVLSGRSNRAHGGEKKKMEFSRNGTA